MNNEALQGLTIEQIEAALSEKKKQAQAEREKEAKAYVQHRDFVIEQMIGMAVDIEQMMVDFKAYCNETMDDQASNLEAYGKLRGNSKGGFAITHTDSTRRVIRIRRTEPQWDERAGKAVGMIRDFLNETVKKHNKKLFQILMTFVERNEEGDLEYARVMNLIQHEDKYTDPRWVEGINLIKESYSNRLKGYGYEFKVAKEDGKWHTINMTFASI